MLFGICLWKTDFLFFSFLFCISLFLCIRIYYILRCFMLPSPLPKGKPHHRALTIIALDTSIVTLISWALSMHHISVCDTALSGKDSKINRRMPPAMLKNSFNPCDKIPWPRQLTESICLGLWFQGHKSPWWLGWGTTAGRCWGHTESSKLEQKVNLELSVILKTHLWLLVIYFQWGSPWTYQAELSFWNEIFSYSGYGGHFFLFKPSHQLIRWMGKHPQLGKKLN